MKRARFSRFYKPLWFWLMVLLYFVCMMTADISAEKLYHGRALSHVHQAWMTEALPWLMACSLAVGIGITNVRAFKRRGLQIGLPVMISLIMTVWLIAQPVAYSLDIFRYLWDGRLLVHGVNPYAYVPADPHLAQYRQWPYWGVMDWKHWPEAYPPLAQIYFGLSAYVTNGTVLQYKALLLINDVVSIVLFYAVLVERRWIAVKSASDSKRRNVLRGLKLKFLRGARYLTDRDVQQFTLFTLFPPLLAESFGAGHVDVFAIPWLLLAWLFRLQNKPAHMGVAIAMATCIKIYPVVLFAGLWDRRDWNGILKSLLGFAVVVGLVYAPFLAVGHGLVAFFSRVSQMSYNAGFESVMAKVFGSTIDQHATLIVFAVELIVWYLVLFTRVYELPLERKVCLLGLTFILSSPVVHPWYMMSLLPFAIAVYDVPTLWLAVMSHLTYDEVIWVMYIEYVPAYGLFLWQFFKVWKRKHVTASIESG